MNRIIFYLASLIIICACSDASKDTGTDVPNVGNTGSFSHILVQDAKVKLLWDPVAGAESYNLYFARQSGVSPGNVSTILGGTIRNNVQSGHVEIGLQNGTQYFFRLASVDANGIESLGDEGNVRPQSLAVAQELNDTGITTCANNTNDNIPCSETSSSHPGQDAELGRDSNLQLVKLGAGVAGFDFTKLDSDGFPLINQQSTYEESAWSCVLDRVTGLLWEVKTKDGGLQDGAHTYAWHSTDASTNGGDTGPASGGSCSTVACNTEAYTTAINNLGLCGFNSGWRMPTVEELRSLMNYASPTNPRWDVSMFPNAVNPGDAFDNYYFWSRQTSAAIASAAWQFGYNGGGNSLGSKASSVYRVRLVREYP